MKYCKLCGTLFKFCSGCRWSPITFAKSLGYCSDRCCKEDLNHKDFDGDDWELWATKEFERKYK